MISVEHINEQE